MSETHTEIRTEEEIRTRLEELKNDGEMDDHLRLGKIQAMKWVLKETVSL